MKFLSKAAMLNGHKNSLKWHLHNHLAGWTPQRSHKIVHASDLMKDGKDFCAREFVLLDITKKKPKDEFLTTSLQVTFQIGRDLQTSVVNWFADMGLAVGDWKCMSCGAMHSFQKRPHKCETCGCKAFHPEEVRFMSSKTGVSCGVDLLVDLGQAKHKMVEIKTIDKEEFKKLVMPLAEHRWRTSLYPRIAAESDSPYKDRVNLKEAVVLYTSKGGFGTLDDVVKGWKADGLLKDGDFSPFKEFQVARNDDATEAKCQEAKKVHLFRTGQGGIPKGICDTSFCKRAKNCPVMTDCFSGKYEGVV